MCNLSDVKEEKEYPLKEEEEQEEKIGNDMELYNEEEPEIEKR